MVSTFPTKPSISIFSGSVGSFIEATIFSIFSFAKSGLSFTLVRISRPASLLFPFLSLTKFSVVSNNFELSRLKIKPIAFFLTSAVFNLSVSSISLVYLLAKLFALIILFASFVTLASANIFTTNNSSSSFSGLLNNDFK